MPHIHEQYDFTVSVFIVFGSKVLLVNHPRYHKWLPIGGHIELDEDPEQALFREIQEETGLKVVLLSTKPRLEASDTKAIFAPNYMDVHDANPPHKHIGLIYFAKASHSSVVMSDEHSDIRWVTAKEIDSPAYKLSEFIKFYAKDALARAKS
jgi:8-oxo-dGTP pyrophosphatase MutT (NUDIX family)